MPEFAQPAEPSSEVLRSSYLILKYAHDTSERLLEAFQTVRQARGAGRGIPTDEEQDLLRAMVVFAGAGIDAMTKRLIEDALPALVESSSAARARIEKLVGRHLRSDTISEEEVASISPQKLAKVLLADNPRKGLMEILVSDLTSGSLQSAAELYRALGYFGLRNDVVGYRETDLREVFECRNRIIHELDVDFAQARRNRRARSRDNMVGYTKILLTASSNMLKEVDALLPSQPRRPRGRPRRATSTPA